MTDWMDNAPCRQHMDVVDRTMVPTDKFLTRNVSVDEREALVVCAACPVVVLCARYSLSNDVAGVAGQMTRYTRLRVIEGQRRRALARQVAT